MVLAVTSPLLVGVTAIDTAPSKQFSCCRKHWLSKVGSKASRIENCHFNNEKTLQDIEYRSFEIKK